jgi:hypothetical protein
MCSVVLDESSLGLPLVVVTEVSVAANLIEEIANIFLLRFFGVWFRSDRERDRLVWERVHHPHQGALPAPRHLRLQSVAPPGDAEARAIARDARRRGTAEAEITDQAGIAASGARG